MKYQKLKKIIQQAQTAQKIDGIQSYFWRSTQGLELTYPNIIIKDNDVSFKQLEKLEKEGLVTFSGSDEIVLINSL
jgi:hypothetical protein